MSNNCGLIRVRGKNHYQPADVKVTPPGEYIEWITPSLYPGSTTALVTAETKLSGSVMSYSTSKANKDAKSIRSLIT